MWKILLFSIMYTSTASAAVITYSCNIAQFCDISSMTAVTQPNEVITISGKPTNYVESTAKRITYYVPSTMAYFPGGLFTVFPNVVEFDFNRISVTNLVSNAFGTCGSLNTINMNNGNIPNLPDGFAQQCSKVTRLNLERDEIKALDPNALRGMGNLQSLVLGQNSISCLPPNFFQHTPKLTDINIVGNRLTTIDQNTFRGLMNLVYVTLNGNQIFFIPAIQFSNIPATGFLFQISGNPFYAVDPNFLPLFFGDLKKDPKLQISDSKCTGPYGYPCTEITRLNYQTCSNTALQGCHRNVTATMTGSAPCGPVPSNTAVIECCFAPNGYCSLTKMSPITQQNQPIVVAGKPSNYVNTITMQMVFMEPYVLKYFPTQFFTIFPNTVYVTLNKVQMTDLVPNAFGTCGKVGLITMNYGDIPVLVRGFAQQCSLVTSLNLNYNNIQVIDTNALLGLSNLQELYLSDNNITCIPGNFFQNTLKLTTIFFRRNRIVAIDRFSFRNLPNLKQLDFQSNNLAYITPITFMNIPATGFKFDMSYNKIYAIEPNFFTQLFKDSTKAPTVFMYSIGCITDPYVCGEINTSTYANCNKTLLTTCYNNYKTGVTFLSSTTVAPPCNAL